MEFQTRPEKVIYKYDLSYKDNVHDFSIMVNEILDKYHGLEKHILKSLNLKRKDIDGANFSKQQFRDVMQFYLKER